MIERRANPHPIDVPRVGFYPLILDFLSLIAVIGIAIGCFQISIAAMRWFGFFQH